MTTDETLDKLRKQLDGLDGEILELLAKRIDLVREIGRHKQTIGLTPLDEDRWKKVLEDRLARSEALNLAPEFITDIYELIHAYALEIESGSAP